MSTIIEMMDNIDGVKPGEIRYDGHGNPEPLPTARNSFNVEIKSVFIQWGVKVS